MPVRRNVISHTEEIFRAVVSLVLEHGKTEFSRIDVRRQIGITAEKWHLGYTSMFQGMIKDCPDGAPKVAKKYRGVFSRIRPATYTLTNYGRSLLKDFE